MAYSPGNTPRNTPILILAYDQTIRRMLKRLLAWEGYVAHETGRGSAALRSLRAAEDGAIVYLEPLFLQFSGNEGLRDYVMDRPPHNPHVFLLLAGISNIAAAMAPLRADGYLAQPFTFAQLLNSLEDAVRVLQAKQASHGHPQTKPLQRSRATTETRVPLGGGRQPGGRRVTDESSTSTGESERSDQIEKEMTQEEKMRRITIEVWQKAARDFARYAAQARRKGELSRAAAWEQGRQEARALWQAAKRGEPEPAWMRKYYQR